MTQLVAGILVCGSLSKRDAARFELHQPTLGHIMIHCCFKTLLLILPDRSHLLPGSSAVRLTWPCLEERRSVLFGCRFHLLILRGSNCHKLAGEVSVFSYSPVFSCASSQTILPGVQAQCPTLVGGAKRRTGSWWGFLPGQCPCSFT